MFLSYFERNKITSTHAITGLTAEFPVVSICNYNAFNTPAGNSYLSDLEYEFFKSEAYKIVNDVIHSSRSKIKLVQLQLKHAKTVLHKNLTLYSNISLIQSFGLELKDMMLSCYFGSEPCSPTDFEYFFDINYGNCYKFNSGLNFFNQNTSIHQVITSGDTSGLQLDLNVGREELNDKKTYLKGIHLVIHNRSFKSLLPTYGFNIPTGKATSIGKRINKISMKNFS